MPRAHIIVARASTEPLGYGTIGAVKDLILEDVSGSNAEYVVYPATLTDYFNSESAGVVGMKELVEAYMAKDCPNNAPLVLMGYSQGAQVVADYVSGQNVAGFPFNSSLAEPAPESVLSRIAAVITMGDPSLNITNNPAHVGNSTQPGIFERFGNATSVFETSGLEDRTQAYCNALDPYCASAGNFDNITVHLVYVEEFGGGGGGSTASEGAANNIRASASGVTVAMMIAIGSALAYAL
ncbi:carbohydrate esterase family 5 protein [Cercospora zeae-maydis SCOH1-5]|uniref:Carbohydrate esterase family 5 protein n=1 Tax=Cercospora zeae-maydis SCOH1-5 TaxID=717836 RepID=A0A6A6F3X2_9PEZI|nr:carbohydrate esterase family 5 protein [Cercospora zeae-maydis SCOH1-5]